MKLFGFRILVDTVNAKDHMFSRLSFGAGFWVVSQEKVLDRVYAKNLKFVEDVW